MGVLSSRFLFVLLMPALLGFLLVSAVGAQGIQTSPYSAPSTLRGLSGGGLDLAPSNPLGLPGSSIPAGRESDSLYVSDGMLRGILPLIPNLQFGYLYDFGNSRISQGRFTADYLLPFSFSGDSVIFGEAHTEFQSFWKTNNGFNNRVDVSLGAGYRTLLRRNTLLGVNGFYDTSRLGGTWYSSGGLGLEMAALLPGNDAIDLNFNWYGQLFNSNVILNAFRYGPSNYDFEAGYSHELWNGGPDLRLKMTGYQFNIGNSVYGWNAGAELKSRDGVFILKYDVGHDKVNQTYQTVGGFVNVGFQPENLLKGESPFTMPEPIFKSPRSLWRMLTEKVKRDWHQPATIVVNRGCTGQCCNLDRVPASFTMVPSFPGSTDFTSSPLFVSFPAVPNACLDPTKNIVVELDYTFTFSGPPSAGVASWEIAVTDTTGTSVCVFSGFAAYDSSGHAHVAFTLNIGNQSAFTTTGRDPAKIAFIDVIAPPP
jgi:hypothetical protein